MSELDLLEQLLEIEGCLGAALFDSTGKVIKSSSKARINLTTMGALANNLLQNAQKASIEMGTGAGHLVHVEADDGHIVARGITDEKNPLRTKLGLFVVLKTNGNLGLVKLKSASAISAFEKAH